jgi:hypothetical protein
MAASERKQKTSAASSGQAGRIESGLDRLETSLDGAQDAATALRRDMTHGTRDMAKNVEALLAATRKDARKLATAIRRDLADLQKAVTASPAGRKGPSLRRPSATRPTGTARRKSAARWKQPAATTHRPQAPRRS